MRWLLWWRPPCLLRRVIVNLRDESSSIQGVLWSVRGPWLTYRDASFLTSGQPPAKIDGEVVLHRDRVLFMQVLP
jgi:hypothetical protein